MAMHYSIHSNGETEEAIRYDDVGNIFIRSSLIYRFATAKQMNFIIYYDIRVSVEGSLDENGLAEINDRTYCDGINRYDIWIGELNHFDSCESYSELMGKKIFIHRSIEKCDYWPYEPARKYEEYIIGTDEMGEVIVHSCNPDTLNNFFNSNPGEPLFFTPVFFKKEKKKFCESIYHVLNFTKFQMEKFNVVDCGVLKLTITILTAFLCS